MRVKEYMTPTPIVANLDDGLHQTYTRMQEFNIRHMPVVGENEELMGMITDRDLRRPEWMDENPNVALTFRLDNSIKVSDAMSAQPEVLSQDAPIKEAVERFLFTRFGAFPVVDEREQLVGILSIVDVLKAYRDDLEAS